jgi:tRNA(Ile2) C34 agmatinyltransferase TiaS
VAGMAEQRGWSQAQIDRMISIYDYEDGEPVDVCPSCGVMVQGYYWQRNRCGECGAQVRPVEDWEQERGVDEWRTMYYCGRHHLGWTFAREDARVWSRRGWAERKRDYFDRDIISWVRDARVKPV